MSASDSTPTGGVDLPMPLDPGPVKRLLRFRGGPWNGATWRGEVAIGFRVACGPGPWSPESVYMVTDETLMSTAGDVEFVAVPTVVDVPTVVAV